MASVLLMAAIAYYILQRAIIASQGPDSLLRRRLATTGRASSRPILYARGDSAGVLSLVDFRSALYVFVALIWLVPDRRIERVLNRRSE